MSKHSLPFLFCLPLLAICHVGSCQAQSEPIKATDKKELAEIRYVISGLQNARQQLKCFQTNIAFIEKSPAKANGGTKITEINQKIRWIVQEDNLNVQLSSYHKDSNAPFYQETLVSDGTQAKVLRKQNGKLEGAISPTEDYITKGSWNRTYFSDPRYYAYFYSSLKPMDELLTDALKPEFSKLFSMSIDNDLVDGAPCKKITIEKSDKSTKRSIWIDVDHSFLIRQLEIHIKVNNKIFLLRKRHILDIVENQNTWFPKTAEEEYYEGAMDGDVSMPPIARRMEIDTFNASCDIAKSAFEMKWPIGTPVINGFTNETSTIEAPMKN